MLVDDSLGVRDDIQTPFTPEQQQESPERTSIEVVEKVTWVFGGHVALAIAGPDAEFQLKPLAAVAR